MFRSIRSIAKAEGVFALWKGLPPTLLGIIHPLVFFPMYEKLKIYFKGENECLGTRYIMISSIISKVVASAVSYPHEVLRARMYFKVHELTNSQS